MNLFNPQSLQGYLTALVEFLAFSVSIARKESGKVFPKDFGDGEIIFKGD